MKIVFMGTPDFAVPSLHALTEAGYAVAAVVTQPDKPKGRGKTLLPTPVKEEAVMHDIPVYQPEKVRNNPEFLEILKEINPDIIVVAAYGQIIPDIVLNYPKYGAINVHGSLLPKLRGGAPIHHAIINGDKEIGVTIMYMDKRMDAGDIISQRAIPLTNDMTLDIAYEKLAIIGRDLLIETIPSIINGTNNRIHQDENEVTFGYNITKEEEKINFDDTSMNVYNKIRGLSSVPGAYAIINNKRMKVYSSTISDIKSKNLPGVIEDIRNDGIYVNTKDYIIKLTDIKLEGKKRCQVHEFINGIKKEDYIGVKFE